MLKYVKICPRCGHPNDEFAEMCAQDGEFLGMVPAIPVDCAPRATDVNAAAVEDRPEGAASRQLRRRLYLEVVGSDKCYEVAPGDVLGQSHPTSASQIRLQDISGVNYVHRAHCSFAYGNGHWSVTAIPQPGYTNPTYVNQDRLAPGQSARLSNGDRLMLSSVALHVRIVEMP